MIVKLRAEPAEAVLPESPISTGEGVPEFVRLILPLAEPALVGANVAVNVLFCPTARTRGTVSPLMENPLPLTVACVTLSEAVPEFVRVTVLLVLLPTGMLAKLTLAGEAVSWPVPVVAPVPLRAIVSGELGVSFTRFTAPVTAPDDVGEKVTVKVTL